MKRPASLLRSTEPIFGPQTVPRTIVYFANDLGLWNDRGFSRELERVYGDAPRRAYRSFYMRNYATCASLGSASVAAIDDATSIAFVIAARGVCVFQGCSPIRYDALERGLIALMRDHKVLHISAKTVDDIRGAEWTLIEEALARALSHYADCVVTLYD